MLAKPSGTKRILLIYLATWLDRYSRKAIGWDVRETMPEDLVSEALRRALAVRQTGGRANSPF